MDSAFKMEFFTAAIVMIAFMVKIVSFLKILVHRRRALMKDFVAQLTLSTSLAHVNILLPELIANPFTIHANKKNAKTMQTAMKLMTKLTAIACRDMRAICATTKLRLIFVPVRRVSMPLVSIEMTITSVYAMKEFSGSDVICSHAITVHVRRIQFALISKVQEHPSTVTGLIFFFTNFLKH
jgi:hypothetical protein